MSGRSRELEREIERERAIIIRLSDESWCSATLWWVSSEVGEPVWAGPATAICICICVCTSFCICVLNSFCICVFSLSAFVSSSQLSWAINLVGPVPLSDEFQARSGNLSRLVLADYPAMSFVFVCCQTDIRFGRSTRLVLLLSDEFQAMSRYLSRLVSPMSFNLILDSRF